MLSLAQIAGSATDWRFVIFSGVVAATAVVAVAVAKTYRRRPIVADMPVSLFSRDRQSLEPVVVPSSLGPRGGNVVRLDAPPPMPPGPVAVFERRPPPPLADHSSPPTPPPPPEHPLSIVIDLTELESEPAPSTIDLRTGYDLSQLVPEEVVVGALPADPWA